jgi:hypothetical protein
MTHSTTSLRLALALLEWARVDAELIGDLFEEHERRKSTTWLWTQAVAAAAKGVLREVGGHPRSSLTGALTGLTASLLLLGGTGQLMLRLGWLTHAVEWQSPQYAVLLAMGGACAIASAWVVARLHASHRAAAVIGFLGAVVLAPIWKLPLMLRLYPATYGASLEPHLPFLLLSIVLVAPPCILVGGLLGSRGGGEFVSR